MDAAPYFAPTYFAPTYFANDIAAVPPPPAAGPSPYFAPTYFTPTYFPGGPAFVIPPPPVPVLHGRDGAAYAALLGLLRGTHAFDAVLFGDPTRRGHAGAGVHPLAIVSPRGWEESDDYDPAMIVRRVTFAVRVAVLAADEDEPFDQLDKLASVVQDAVDRSDLLGTCLPALTRVRSGRYDHAARFPEWSVDLEGEFTSIVDPTTHPAASAGPP